MTIPDYLLLTITTAVGGLALVGIMYIVLMLTLAFQKAFFYDNGKQEDDHS